MRIRRARIGFALKQTQKHWRPTRRRASRAKPPRSVAVRAGQSRRDRSSPNRDGRRARRHRRQARPDGAARDLRAEESERAIAAPMRRSPKSSSGFEPGPRPIEPTPPRTEPTQPASAPAWSRAAGRTPPTISRAPTAANWHARPRRPRLPVAQRDPAALDPPLGGRAVLARRAVGFVHRAGFALGVLERAGPGDDGVRHAAWPTRPLDGGCRVMGVVVAKLLLVDLSRTAGITRIISFVGVGVLMLVIGYSRPFRPRPRRRRHDAAYVCPVVAGNPAWAQSPADFRSRADLTLSSRSASPLYLAA